MEEESILSCLAKDLISLSFSSIERFSSCSLEEIASKSSLKDCLGAKDLSFDSSSKYSVQRKPIFSKISFIGFILSVVISLELSIVMSEGLTIESPILNKARDGIIAFKLSLYFSSQERKVSLDSFDAARYHVLISALPFSKAERRCI